MSKSNVKRIKVVHLISGLPVGGAEMMLYKFLSGYNHDVYDMQVISLTSVGEMGKRIQNLGVPVTALGMQKNLKSILLLFKLISLLKKEKPDILQTWMYNADFLGFFASKIAGIPNLIWNIRHSDLNPQQNKKMTIILARLCALLSSFTTAIICCSQASYVVHSALGYCKKKMVVIPNGFNLKEYHPNVNAKLHLLREFNLPGNANVIGLIARWNPQKDHKNFVSAASILSQHLPNVYYLLCGDGVTWENQELVSWITTHKLNDKFLLLGRRDDIPKLIAGFDLVTSSSAYGEGFPNVLGEAMASGVPCVATDVGDSAYIIGDTGITVSPRNPEKLANAWMRMINRTDKDELGIKARNRILSNFDIDKIINTYQNLYQQVINR